MDVVICKNYEELSRNAAGRVVQKIREMPDCTLGLTTGNTPCRMYAMLGEMHEKEHVDFSGIYTLNLEEFLGVRKDSTISFYNEMQKNFFSKVNIPSGHILFPDSMEADFQKSCREYDTARKIDLLVVGIGSDGHIGFHTPSDRWRRKTSVCSLSEQEKAGYGDPKMIPDFGIALGFEGLMQSGEIILMAAGPGKAGIIGKLVKRDIMPEVPASFLTLHPHVTLLIDEEAAALL